MSAAPTLFDDELLDAAAAPQQRVLVVWYPDWPVLAAAGDDDPQQIGIAVSEGGTVLSCSAYARAHGVRRGMRRREAQSRLPSLRWVPYDATADARAFEPLLGAVEHLCPGVAPIRPGMCATGARGPSRYFGGEELLIDAVGDYLESLGFPDARFGVADGAFAATQAARADLVIAPGESAAFLAALPVETLERPELADLLRRMGLRTLGEFAALSSTQVASRFGADGVLAHRMAAGRERRRLATRTPPAQLCRTIELDEPVERTDTLSFLLRPHADRFISALAGFDLVCTTLRVSLVGVEGEVIERQWRHPQWFTAADVIDRVRWQLQAASPADRATRLGMDAGGLLRSAVRAISLRPDEAERIGEHAPELWGTNAPDEQVHRAFSRVQSLLDHTAVLTATPTGGRAAHEHSALTPWGERPRHRRTPEAPWPGRVPDPAPTQVLDRPQSVLLCGVRGAVTISERGVLSEPPARLRFRDGHSVAVTGWAGPWRSDERWWDVAAGRDLTRIQVSTRQAAYLLVHSTTGWWVEGIYD